MIRFDKGGNLPYNLSHECFVGAELVHIVYSGQISTNYLQRGSTGFCNLNTIKLAAGLKLKSTWVVGVTFILISRSSGWLVAVIWLEISHITARDVVSSMLDV